MTTTPYNGTDLNDTSVGCFAQGTEGDLTQCVLDGLFAAGPSPALVGLVMGGTLLTSMYVAGDGSVVTPAVVTILLAPVLAVILPPQFAALAYSVAFVGAAAGVFAAYTRFTHQGGF